LTPSRRTGWSKKLTEGVGKARREGAAGEKSRSQERVKFATMLCRYGNADTIPGRHGERGGYGARKKVGTTDSARGNRMVISAIRRPYALGKKRDGLTNGGLQGEGLGENDPEEGVFPSGEH